MIRTPRTTTAVDRRRGRLCLRHHIRTPIAPGPGVGVLFIGEAAARLGMRRTELEAMIERGGVETLPMEFGRVIPTHEVERLVRTLGAR